MEATKGIGALFQRIALITGEVGVIAKDKQHAQGYTYVGADAVMGHLNSLMAKYGLVIIPNVIDTTIVQGADKVERWLVTYEFIIADIDGNSMTSRWTGEAPLYLATKDGRLMTDDKSMGKAHTYAYKYYLMKLFMVSNVKLDDLDENGNEEKPSRGNASKPAANRGNQANSGASSSSSGAPKGDTPDWHSDVMKKTAFLYDNTNHQENSIAKALNDKLISHEITAFKAAVILIEHRIETDYKFSRTETLAAIENALGGNLITWLNKNKFKFADAYKLIKASLQ